MRQALAALFLAAAIPAGAQTLQGVTLGQPIPEGLPTPDDTQTQAPFTRTIWAERDGVSTTAIADSETGEVQFIELRPTTPAPTPAGIEGLTFAETTQADLHARFGSEGIVFANVGRAGVFGEMAVYFTNYEIADSNIVVSFVTLEPLAGASEGTAAHAVLDSVVVAQDGYLNQVWGLNRGRLPGYAPIPDPFHTD